MYVGGADGKSQPSDLADFLLHETACADFKYLLKRSAPPGEPLRETREQFDRRVQMLVREANKHLNLESLCCEYLGRAHQLFNRDGDRLPKYVFLVKMCSVYAMAWCGCEEGGYDSPAAVEDTVSRCVRATMMDVGAERWGLPVTPFTPPLT